MHYHLFHKYPQGDLNPCLQAENLASWAARRWGHDKCEGNMSRIKYSKFLNRRFKTYYIYFVMSIKFSLEVLILSIRFCLLMNKNDLKQGLANDH